MRVVIDTNVLVSGIFWKGPPYRILDAWAEGRFSVFASAGMLEEYFEVVDRVTVKVGKEELARKWKTYIFDHCELVDPDYSFTYCRDPDDVIFVECAVSGGADFIVSGDAHLLELKSVEGITILPPAKFLERLK